MTAPKAPEDSAPSAAHATAGVATHCPYCAFQCGMRVTMTAAGAKIAGDPAFPLNRGQLCVKGFTAAATLDHPERLRTPLVRGKDGVLAPATWDEALDRVAEAIRRTQARHGPDAVAVFGSGALTNEKCYLLGKFARVALGSRSIDYNGRFCMSSAAAAGNKAFGLDRGLPFPVEDIAGAEVVLLAGANVVETLPPIVQHLDAQHARGGKLIVADPRRSRTAADARLHLQLVPGSDAALANGILHVLVRDKLVDHAYIDARTEGWSRAREVAATYWPERVEQITGVPAARFTEAAHLLGEAKSAMILTGRGADQHAQGVNITLAYINLALALGLVGKPMSGYGCLTGQGNGQGGREHGQKADQLPGYRRIDDPAARRHVASVWGVPEESLPGPGKSAYEMLSTLGQDGGARALLVFGSNILVCTPDARTIESRLRALDFLVVADFFLSETAALADVVLPAAQWAEEEGTTTNLEGRVILRRRAREPPPGARTDIDIVCAIAARLGKGQWFDYAGAQPLFDELARASAGGPADYAGITYARIEAENGVFWPCPSPDHPGSPRMFADRFPTPTGRARFHAIHHQPPAEERSPDYPFYLTTGRLLAHYQSGTQTRRTPQLARIAPAAIVQMHPQVARRHGLAAGDQVTLESPRGAATFLVDTTSAIREDTLFAPFHWGGDSCVNLLTNPALDPTSRMPEFKVCSVRIRPGARSKGDAE